MSKLLIPSRKIVARPPTPPSNDERIAAVFDQIIKEAQDLDDTRLRDLWMDAIRLFVQTGDINSLFEVTKWRRLVCPLDEFLFGAAYLGLSPNEVYPGIMDALTIIDSDRYDEIVEKGAIGIGKTYMANLGMARDLYKLSCMRSPQQVYGIAKGSPIVFTIQSVRLTTARKVVFEEFGRFVRNSPYFQNKYPLNPFITSDMIFPEHNIRIMPVSSSGSAVISMNVIGGQMDEMNFMQKTIKSKSSQADEQGGFDQAKQLYNTLASRRKSRFIHRGNLPGALYLISSSRFPDDFTELKAREALEYGGTDARIFVFEGSQWSVKGRDRFSDDEFKVQIGNETFPSKVLEPGQEPNVGCDVINVPVDFHDDFVRDVDGAIRDIAGMTTLATKPFFSQRQKIAEANALAVQHGYLNPMYTEQVELSIGIPDLDRLKVRTDVKAVRAAHIDLGITKDACGFAVGHIAGQLVREFKNDTTGKMDTEVLPVIAYDVICRIVPPLGGEIELDSVRKFLRKLNTKYNLGIKYVTFDGFQSVDSRQILNKQGFTTGYLSVEKPEPWRSFRDALYDGRILLPGHNYLNKELAEVETTVDKNKEKVDHRPNGTKDVADAVVGVATYLLRRRDAWSQLRLKGGATGMFLLGDAPDGTPRRNKPTEPADNVSGRPQPIRRTIQRRGILRK